MAEGGRKRFQEEEERNDDDTRYADYVKNLMDVLQRYTAEILNQALRTVFVQMLSLIHI